MKKIHVEEGENKIVDNDPDRVHLGSVSVSEGVKLAVGVIAAKKELDYLRKQRERAPRRRQPVYEKLGRQEKVLYSMSKCLESKINNPSWKDEDLRRKKRVSKDVWHYSVRLKTITEEYNRLFGTQEKLHFKTIRKILDDLGFGEYFRKPDSAVHYRLSLKEFKKKVRVEDPSFFSLIKQLKLFLLARLQI